MMDESEFFVSSFIPLSLASQVGAILLDANLGFRFATAHTLAEDLDISNSRF
jgi:hypothetical protein